MSDAATLDLIREFSRDRWVAHKLLFRHRHPDPSPEAHRLLVEHIYAPGARRLIEGFRGFAKSTYLEEAAVLRGALREFHNMVIVGASYSRAVDRLAAIKRELEMNEYLTRLFGPLKGEPWQEGKIVLSNGACIQALGRDQSMLGMKHLDYRPDAALIDDVEDPEEVRTDAERQQTWEWFLKTFLPSLDHPLNSWVRVLGTRRGSGSLPERLERDGWPAAKFPIEHLDSKGARTATWSSKFPLRVIDQMRETYRGDMHTWMQEYMCQPSSESDRVFRREMFRVVPRERTWQACYAMIDPARTATRNSASTGWAVWSWLSNRLVVWAAGADMLLPDEIVKLAFEIAERFDPVWLGVEADGLEQFLLQPLRHEQVRRGTTIPLKPLRAPRGKLDFIKGLQPFFNAREVEFAQPMKELEDQLISFPSGRIDAPNALAYALQMRPALPIYDNFTADHIVATEAVPGRPTFLAANATGAMTAAVLLQIVDGHIAVLADWLREGAPSETVADIHAEASLLGDTAREVEREERPTRWEDMLKAAAPRTIGRLRQPPTWVVPPHHAERYNNVGLMQAVRAIPAELRTGGIEVNGQSYLREQLSRMLRAGPAVEISPSARWTLRAMSGGYTRALRAGRVQDYPEEGPYRLLMEGVESFLGMVRAGLAEPGDEEDIGLNYSYDRQGRRYQSAMPARR